MKVMLTGINGYLGKSLDRMLNISSLEVLGVVRQSHQRNSEKNHIVCDLVDISAVAEIGWKFNPDIIIHCAAFVPKRLEDYQNSNLYPQNIQMLKNLVSVFNCPIVYISSMTVYGESFNVIRKESDAGNPQSDYGKSKYECEKVLQESKKDSIAIRIPGLFGKGRDTGLVANILKAILFNHDLRLPDSPLIWAAIDVKDASNYIFQLALSQYSGFHAINVGYDEIYSINRLLAICEEICRNKIAYDYDIVHPNFSYDLSVLRSFNIQPKEGLKRALTNYRNYLLCKHK